VIWIQEKEFASAKPKYRKELLTAQKQGRLRLLSGKADPAFGISVTPGGSHTPGSQYVTVETLNGRVILAGDTTYLAKNNRSHLPVGITVNSEEDLRTIRQMHREAASPFYILPGHDPLVMQWFPKVSPGIVQITPALEPE
jgi:glyoxylase-like metal-dependent hydrolase (beta-lactamase superfamily II)